MRALEAVDPHAGDVVALHRLPGDDGHALRVLANPLRV
jgi:hypothetical protein